MRRVIALLAWTALVLTPLVSSAQIGGGGSIQGLVLDTSNLAVPGATVLATNVATGISTTAQTTSAGVYALRPLPPGEYRVTVSLAGFQTVTREGIIVDALGVVGLNITLQVGGITQGVEVTASAPLLATADARLGQTIRNDVYTALPLVMNTGGPRDPTAFMFLMPGVQSIGRWGNVMGGQDFTTDMYVEGIPDDERRGPGGRPQSVVRHLRRRGRSVPGRDKRNGGDVQRPGRVQLRRQVRDERVPWQRVRVPAEQGARREVVLRDGQAGRQPARVRRDARRPDPQEPDVLLRGLRRVSRPPSDGIRADVDSDDGRAEWRLQRAARHDLRSANDTAQSQRHRLRSRSVSGQRHPAGSDLVHLAILPVVSSRSNQRGAAEQLSRRVAADWLQQREPDYEGGPEADHESAAIRAVFPWQAQSGDALPWGDQSANGPAAAVYRDAARRRGSDERPGQAHIRSGIEVGEPGERGVLPALGADFQRDGRWSISDQRRSAGTAGW